MSIALRIALLMLMAALTGCAPEPVRAPAGLEPHPRGGTSPDAAREAVVYALTLVGAPYRNGGASPESGFDCSGFVWYVYRKATGLALPRSADEMGRTGQPVSAEELRPGDLVFYNTLGREFSHVGIYLGEHRFVHAPSSGGTVGIVSMRNGYWARRYSGARRVAA
jgi:cell wall-associated NlpC family hydrolase